MIRIVRYGLWAAILIVGLALAVMLLLPQDRGTILAGKPFGGPFTLIDYNGAPITEQALRGHPSAVFFGFTHCPEVCPTTLFEMDNWLNELGPAGSGLKAYFVTVDPERDTAPVLKDYVTSVSDRIIGITGDPGAVAAMLKAFSIYSAKTPLEGGDYSMDHTASVFLLDSGGRLMGTIAYGEAREHALAKLAKLVK